VGIALIIIWCIAKYVKNSNLPQDDSFYYLTVDELGKESLIHDSGIRPSKTGPGNVINLQILKKDYIDGKPMEVSRPVYLKMGINPRELKWKVYPENVIEEDVNYIVSIKIPDNPIFGTNVKFPIDLREECGENKTSNDSLID